MSLLDSGRVAENDVDVVKRFTSDLPVKVGGLAEDLGLRVTRTPLPPKFSGLIRPSPDADAGFEIRVNKFESPERQRFTVAHEIAHYLLHRNDIHSGIVDSVMYRSTLTSRKETEANQLAAEILMPADAVAIELRRLGGVRTDDAVQELAAIFRVSVPAMRVRLGVA